MSRETGFSRRAHSGRIVAKQELIQPATARQSSQLARNSDYTQNAPWPGCPQFPKEAASEPGLRGDRIHRLKGLTVEVRAGNAIRNYKLVKSDGPDDPVFQGVLSGGPLRDNNVLVRFIKPAARSMELPWVNWRSLRTSHATSLKMAGADVKDAQAQLRHARSSTELEQI